jgi:hypothetical protein
MWAFVVAAKFGEGDVKVIYTGNQTRPEDVDDN